MDESTSAGVLADRVAIVTGASRGLGRAIALGLAEAGADVVVSSRSAEACEAVADEVRSRGRRALALGCHVGDWSACEELVRGAVENFGRLDILVNNAGIAPPVSSLDALSEELVDKTLAVNLKGPLRLTALAAPHLPEGGAVINISSKASVRPAMYTAVYAAAKSGLNALTAALAQELGPRGIRVNTIVCGPFHTASFDRSVPTPELLDMARHTVALKRIAQPEEIVGTVLYLATPASSYVNGALIPVDGGDA